MDDKIFDILLEIKKKYGGAVFEDKKRLDNILKDLLIGEVKYEQHLGKINALMYAIEQHAYDKLMRYKDNPAKTQQYFIKLLKNKYSLNDEAALFAINALCVVIGIDLIETGTEFIQPKYTIFSSVPLFSFLNKIIDKIIPARKIEAESNFRASKKYFEKQDYVQAIFFCTKAAERGYAEAQLLLGDCYCNGDFISQNYSKAMYWYIKAVKHGYVSAQNNLGVCYYNGYGEVRNYKKAVYWFRKATKQGYAEAQNNLGKCYCDGNGVAQDYRKAVYWFNKAIEQGYAKAQYNLGECYYDGNGITQDYMQAVYWYTKAAEQDYAPAQCWLGICYQDGKGVTRDFNKAKYWLKKASDQGFDYEKEIMRLKTRDKKKVNI